MRKVLRVNASEEIKRLEAECRKLIGEYREIEIELIKQKDKTKEERRKRMASERYCEKLKKFSISWKQSTAVAVDVLKELLKEGVNKT